MPNFQTGAQMIAEERTRQIEKEGYSAEHDDSHEHGDLASAAVAYTVASGARMLDGEDASEFWPWQEDFKPADSEVGNLVKAGALIAAEIDRIMRKLSA